MALVGEARIKVVADTSKVRQMIQDGFKDLNKEAETTGQNVSKSLNKGMSSGSGRSDPFKKFKEESKKMSSEFHKAIRSSYKWQAASGALLQSLSALGGGLLALVGNIGGAASAGIALVGVMAQIKIASLVAKQAFKGIMAAVKKDSANAGRATKTIKELREEMQQLAFAAEQAALSEEAASIKLEKAREDLARVSNLPPDNRARREAQLAYSEAELAYRKAKDKNADAQDAILNPKRKNKAAQDPYKGLTESQKKFALYLKDVMPRFKELNEAAAKGFLPELQKQMETMFRGGFFERLKKGFGDVSIGLGKATKEFAGTLFDPRNKENLSSLFKSTGTTLPTLGKTLGNVFSGFLALMRAINPLVTRFTSFLSKKSLAFADNMKGDFANVQVFFKNAGDAAAGWGAIIGRIFTKFKEMIKANIGPGTGGQLLLDFFNKGTAGFRGLDGAAGEFARKNHFLASATNLKAMLESVSKIFSFMSDLGTDPAIAGFWDILSELEGPLSSIFENIQGSSDELANMLVTIVEIVASFADSGQLNSYMVALTAILDVLGGLARMIAPVMQQFGGLIGTIGALVTTFYLLKKVTMLTYGTYLIFTKGIAILNIAMKAKRVIDMSLLAVERAKAAAALKGRILTDAQTAGIMRETIANRMAAITKAANASGNIVLGATSTAATGPVAALGIAVLTATWPIIAIVAAIALVVAGLVLLAGHMNAVKADKIKKAHKEIDKSFSDTRDRAIGAADAQNQWSSALDSVSDTADNSIISIRDVGKALDETGQKIQVNSLGDTIIGHSQAYYQAKEAMDVYVGSLAKLAKKNLPEAQRQFRNMVVSSGMSRQATMDAITSNKAMVKSLEAQAKAMGDTIMNADGTVNALKALDYSIGEGSYIRQKAILEQKKFAETFKNAASTFIDSNEAMQNATSNGKLNLNKYIKEMQGQSTALLNWRKNISKLNALFTDKNVLQGIIAQGSAGAGLVESLADGGADAVKKYTDVQSAVNKAKADADTFTKAFSNVDAVAAAVRKKFANSAKIVRDDMTSELNNLIGKGAGAFEIASSFGIKEADVVAQQRLLDSGADLAKGVNLTAQWDAENLKKVGTDLQKAVGNVTLQVKTSGVVDNPMTPQDESKVTSKNGGYIKRAMGGLVSYFADGTNYNGRVSGPGTGRSDQIPAMISNGEFVVNARATAQNMDLLNAINSNKNVSGAAGNQIAITVNAAPGMDEQQVAAQVARQLNAQLSRGGSL